MVKKKASDKKKNNSRKVVVKGLQNLIIFIIKMPYFLLVGAFFFFKTIWKAAKSLFAVMHTFFLSSKANISKMQENKNEKEIMKKKESMVANYEEFRVIETLMGEFKKWEDTTIESDSKIGIIIGARGSGKSAFGIKFLENVYAKAGKKCYAIGFNKEDMPSWIEVVENISEIKNNAFVLIDEGGVLFSARDAMSKANKLLSDLILISRHKSLSILFISQNSANLDIDILRQADYLVLKQSSLLQLDFERKKIKEIYEEVMPVFDKYKDMKGITYVYSDIFTGFITNPLPSFWSTNISKSFK